MAVQKRYTKLKIAVQFLSGNKLRLEEAITHTMILLTGAGFSEHVHGGVSEQDLCGVHGASELVSE